MATRNNHNRAAQLDTLKILDHAIQKATANGWKTEPLFAWIPADRRPLLAYWTEGDKYKAVIYNHDFAKALWGEHLQVDVEIHTNPFAMEDDQPDVVRTTEAWKLHLRNMVIAADPIQYLGAHLK